MTPDPQRTGWPPGLMQDDSRELGRWLADKPEARKLAQEAAAEIRAACADKPKPRWKTVACPLCNAKPGESCGRTDTSNRWWTRTAPHLWRVQLAKGSAK